MTASQCDTGPPMLDVSARPHYPTAGRKPLPLLDFMASFGIRVVSAFIQYQKQGTHSAFGAHP